MRLVLYGVAGGCSRVTMTALEETGAPYSYEVVRFVTHENLSPAYLAKNPLGKIPCLVPSMSSLHDGYRRPWC